MPQRGFHITLRAREFVSSIRVAKKDVAYLHGYCLILSTQPRVIKELATTIDRKKYRISFKYGNYNLLQ
jgi:hypothetical protein